MGGDLGERDWQVLSGKKTPGPRLSITRVISFDQHKRKLRHSQAVVCSTPQLGRDLKLGIKPMSA